MPDPRQGPEAGKETEEGRRDTYVEGRTLALTDEPTTGELIADHERPRARRIQNPDARLQLPGVGEKRRQIDAGVPIDARLERLAKQDAADTAATVSGKLEFLTAVDPGIG